MPAGTVPTFTHLSAPVPTRRVSSGSVSHPRSAARQARYSAQRPPTVRVKTRKPAWPS